MSSTVILILILVFSVLVTGTLRRYAGRWGFVPDLQYIVIGALLGQTGFRVMDAEILAQLGPFISLVMGILGFVLGVALRRRLATVSALEGGTWVAVVTLVSLCGGFYLILRRSPIAIPGDPLWLGLTLGAAGAAVALPSVERTLASLKARGPVTELVRSYCLGLSVLAVATAGTALALRRSGQSSNRLGLTEAEWLMALFGIGIACGVLFVLFLGKKKAESDDRLFLATVGIITFASGMGLAAGVSPLLVNMMAGVVVSMISSNAEVLHEHLERLERPSVVLLYIFAGALWQPVEGWLWLAPAIFIVARIVVSRIACGSAHIAFPHLPGAPRVGRALIHQGGLAVAIAVNHALVNPFEGPLVLSAVLAAVVTSDLIGTASVRLVIMDAGEHERTADVTTPAVLQAAEEEGLAT